MHEGFLGLCVLAAILWGHGVYVWHEAKKQGVELTRARKVQLVVIAVLTVAALVAGIVLMLCAAEDAAIHAMGLAALCLAFWANSALRRG